MEVVTGERERKEQTTKKGGKYEKASRIFDRGFAAD